MDKRAGPVAEISLESGEISLTGMEVSPYKHVQRYRRKLFLTTVKSMSKQQNCPGKRDEIFSYKHINTREIHPAYRAVSLSGPVRLPYKQALRPFRLVNNIPIQKFSLLSTSLWC